jgi:hypothetical protein
VKYTDNYGSWERGRKSFDYPVVIHDKAVTITVLKRWFDNRPSQTFDVIVDREIYEILKRDGRRLAVKVNDKGAFHRKPQMRVCVYMSEERPDSIWALSWFVLGHRAEPGTLADHINGNDLDNRKSNLRWATHQQNMQNRTAWNKYSEHAGVHYDVAKGRWTAGITRSFATREEAEAFSQVIHNVVFGDYAKVIDSFIPDTVAIAGGKDRNQGESGPR